MIACLFGCPAVICRDGKFVQDVPGYNLTLMYTRIDGRLVMDAGVQSGLCGFFTNGAEGGIRSWIETEIVIRVIGKRTDVAEQVVHYFTHSHGKCGVS